jgi:multidrug resistance protein, MATE family
LGRQVSQNSIWLALVGLVTYTKLRSRYNEFNIFRPSTFKALRENFLSLARVGFPIGLHVGTDLAAVMIVTIFANLIGGENMLIANQVSDQYLRIFILVSFGYGQTASALISQQFGAKNFYNARRIGNTALSIGFVTSVSVGIILALAYKPLSNFLSANIEDNDAQFDNLLQNLFIINGICLVADFGRNLSTAALRGYFYTKIPMIFSTISLAGGISLGYVLGFVKDYGLEGIYAARAGGMFVGASLINLMWYFISNKKVKEHAYSNIEIITDKKENPAPSIWSKCSNYLNSFGIFHRKRNDHKLFPDINDFMLQEYPLGR